MLALQERRVKVCEGLQRSAQVGERGAALRRDRTQSSSVSAVGTALALAVLLEGSVYWLLKLFRPAAAPPGMGAYAVLRWLNPTLLVLALPVLVGALATGPVEEALPGLLFWVLATLEQVNYFHTQLMYDNGADLRRLRRSGLQRAHLGRDIARR